MLKHFDASAGATYMPTYTHPMKHSSVQIRLGQKSKATHPTKPIILQTYNNHNKRRYREDFTQNASSLSQKQNGEGLDHSWDKRLCYNYRNKCSTFVMLLLLRKLSVHHSQNKSNEQHQTNDNHETDCSVKNSVTQVSQFCSSAKHFKYLLNFKLLIW